MAARCPGRATPGQPPTRRSGALGHPPASEVKWGGRGATTHMSDSQLLRKRTLCRETWVMLVFGDHQGCDNQNFDDSECEGDSRILAGIRRRTWVSDRLSTFSSLKLLAAHGG